MVSVRTVAEGDWELMRDVRLAALRDAPDAFGSTYAREAPFTEEQEQQPLPSNPSLTEIRMRLPL